MYNAFFGLREKPFNVTPDPRFLFENASYQEAYANLFYGIRERKGFVVLTGEAGTGKTTLLRRVMDGFEEALRFVFFYNTTLSFEELLDHIFVELQLAPPTRGGRLQKIQTLNQFLISQLEQGGTVALLIDEAQNLSDEVLENLRLLSNLETTQDKLLQIILSGQPELEAKLSRPHLRQLKQRIVTWCHLDHLKDAEVGAFVTHRLQIAGYQGPALFTADAIQRLTLYSQGIPRLVNVICDNALLLTYAASKREISAEIIEEAARDLQLIAGARRLPSFESPPAKAISPAQVQPPSGVLAPLPTQPEIRTKPSPSTPIPLRREERVASSSILGSLKARHLRLGLALLLLLTVSVTAFLKLSTESVPNSATEMSKGSSSLVSLLQSLNASVSSLLMQTTGLTLEEPHAAPSRAPQEVSQETAEAFTGEVVSSSKEGEKAEALPLTASSILGKQLGADEMKAPPSASKSRLVSSEVTRILEKQENSSQPDSAQSQTLSPMFREELRQVIHMQAGTTILNLVRKTYGNHNTLALVLIKYFNPHLNNLDEVAAGETIWLPPLTPETLMREQSDGSYRLLVAAFPKATTAHKLVDMIRQSGYTAEVVTDHVAQSLVLHRVEILGLPSKTVSQQVWNFVDTTNELSAAPRSAPKGLPARLRSPQERVEELPETGL